MFASYLFLHHPHIFICNRSHLKYLIYIYLNKLIFLFKYIINDNYRKKNRKINNISTQNLYFKQ